MLKNFSPSALGINGRQSELIELALTYGFNAMDVDMHEMLRRAQRTTVEDASKYLAAATDFSVGGFPLNVDLDSDDEAFTSQVGGLHPVADFAKGLGASRAYVCVPAATDRLPYHEYFDVQRNRLDQIAEVLAAREIKMAVGFASGKELEEGKEFPFIRNVEGFLALINALSSSNAGALIDTWDWVVGDGAMDQFNELTVEKIVAVRLASVPDDVDTSKAETNQRVVPVLNGPLDHVKIISRLKEIGFDGPVSPSASSQCYKGQTRESLVQRAQQAVDAISKEAGVEVRPLPMDSIEEDAPYEPTPSL
ncbi:MAG: TIM barrel protein [Rubripirellula sp.]